MVKQNDVTQLNKDNARLVTEVGALGKQFAALRMDYQVAQDAVTTWRDKSIHQDAQWQAAQQRHTELQAELEATKKLLAEQTDKAQQSAVALIKAEMLIASQEQALQALQRPAPEGA
jgi:chromosome segregation ATPase